MVEREPDGEAGEVECVTLFLTGSECPWRCLMCDLWRHTHAGPTPAGSLPAQMEQMLAELPPRRTAVRHLKLYNAGSFADPRAVPQSDYPAVARLCAGFDRVIVECHPSLVGDRLFRFGALLDAPLEVAMGLETAHPEVLARLNKGMTLAGFEAAARHLTANGIDLRSFVLLRPPWMTELEGIQWTAHTVSYAFSCGSRIAAIVPARAGNGAMDDLQQAGEFTPPAVRSLEAALAQSLELKRGLVVADLWDLRLFSRCDVCFEARRRNLEYMNLQQRAAPIVVCGACSQPL